MAIMSCSTLHNLVKTAVLDQAESTAVVYDNMMEKISVTYAQLWEISTKVKNIMSGVVRKNEVVGICPLLDHRMPAVLIGVLRLSASFYNFTVSGFEYTLKVMREVGLKVIFIHQDYYKVLERKFLSLKCDVISVETPGLKDYFIVQIKNLDSKQYDSNLGYCITTSGTTGTPKIVLVPHTCIVPNITHLRDIFSLTSDDLVLAATALTFDPSIVEIFMTLSSGSCLLILPQVVKMVPGLLLQCITERNHVTVMQITPTLLLRFNTEQLSETILGDKTVLRVVALGGEAFPVQSIAKLRSSGNKTSFYNLYGTTEVSCWATYYKVTDEDFRSNRAVPLGEPLLETVVEIRDKFGHVSTEGNLYIGGKNRKCIIKDEIKDQSGDGTVIMRNSCDVVRMDQRGQLYYEGRNGSQVKRHGQRVDMEEIKMVCLQHDSINSCAVQLINQQLIVFVCCLEMNERNIAVKDIQDYLKDQLPLHWWPDDVILVHNLPVTSHGKLDVAALRKIHADRQKSNGAKLNLVEYLQKRWQEVLGIKTFIKSNATFIQDGGNSLQAVHLANDVEVYFNIRLPELVDMLLNRTYSEIIVYLMYKINKHGHDYNASGVCDIKHDCNLTTDRGNSLKQNDSSSNVNLLEESENNQDNNVTHENLKRKSSSDDLRIIKKHDQVYTAVKSYARSNKVTLAQECRIDVSNGKCNACFCKQALTINEGMLNINVEEIWKYDTGKCVDASLLVALIGQHEPLLFIGSHSHKLSAIDLLTGCSIWETILPDRIESSACLSACGKYVIVGCYDGIVYIMSIDEGTIWWQYDTSDTVKSSPVVAMDTGYVYIGSHSQSIFCLDINERQLVWKRYLGCGSVFSSSAVCHQSKQLYVATLGGKMFSLSLDKGDIVWKYDLYKPVFSSPAVTMSGVCVGGTDCCLYFFNRTGDLVWKVPTGSSIFSSPSVYVCDFISTKFKTTELPDSPDGFNEHIVIGSHDSYVYCVSNSGQVLWKLTTNSAVYSSPYQTVITIQCQKCRTSLGVSKKHGFIVQNQGFPIEVQADLLKTKQLNLEDFKPVSCHKTCNNNVNCGLSLHVSVACSTQGSVYIIHSHTGQLLGSIELNGEIFSSPVVYDNCILVGCRDNYVYCLNLYVK